MSYTFTHTETLSHYVSSKLHNCISLCVSLCFSLHWCKNPRVSWHAWVLLIQHQRRKTSQCQTETNNQFNLIFSQSKWFFSNHVVYVNYDISDWKCSQMTSYTVHVFTYNYLCFMYSHYDYFLLIIQHLRLSFHCINFHSLWVFSLCTELTQPLHWPPSD